jgi:large subunit ribosomal protein L29
MALLRTKEIRSMDAAARDKKLGELHDELMHERGVAAMGGAPPNPGKIRALRKNISRIHTIQSEEAKLGTRALSPAASAPSAPSTARTKRAPKRKEPDEELEEEDEADDEAEDED